MTETDFIEAVNKLEPPFGFKHRHALLAIYKDVREQAVYDLAETVRQRDLATRTHGMLITTDKN